MFRRLFQVQKPRASAVTNQKKLPDILTNQEQTKLPDAHFPARGTGCVLQLYILIGSIHCSNLAECSYDS